MPAKGFPRLQRLYVPLGATENVMLAPFLQFGHNNNAASRGAMYAWVNRRLRLSTVRGERTIPIWHRVMAARTLHAASPQ
jgi:hypothetical protein